MYPICNIISLIVDSNATTTGVVVATVFAAFGALWALLYVVKLIQRLVRKLRSGREKQERKDPESPDRANSCAVEETRTSQPAGDGLGSPYEMNSRNSLRESPRPVPAATNILEYQALRMSPGVDNRPSSTYAEAPTSSIGNGNEVQQAECTIDAGPSNHTPEPLPQDNSTQPALTILPEEPPETANPATRTMSLMQREIDELRARVDELTRRRRLESTRQSTTVISSYSDTAPPSYSEQVEHES